MQNTLIEIVKSILHVIQYYRRQSVLTDRDELTTAVSRVSQFFEFTRRLGIVREEYNSLIAELYDNLQLLIVEYNINVSLQPLEWFK